MSFDRNKLPDCLDYFEAEGLKLIGPPSSKWRSTRCPFHGGSKSLRVNIASGGWMCMACGLKGGDVLAFHMQRYELDFVQAAKALNCWVDDGSINNQQKQTTLSARQALQVLELESKVIYMAASDISKGLKLHETDLQRLALAVGRVGKVNEEFQS